MEREQADMVKIVEKVMENWKEIALVVESIVILMVAFGCGRERKLLTCMVERSRDSGQSEAYAVSLKNDKW